MPACGVRPLLAPSMQEMNFPAERFGLRFDEAKIGVYDVLDIEEVALRREVSHPQPRLLLAAFDACDLRCKGGQGKALILPRTRMVERARYDQARALRQHVGKHGFGRGLGS